MISVTANKAPVVCFKNTGLKILTDGCYIQKKLCAQEKRRRIVETASAITADDIRSQVYEPMQYPPPDNFFENNEALIPETLHIKKKKTQKHREMEKSVLR